MWKISTAVAALALMFGCAQVSSDEYIQPQGQYGRTDGPVQRKDSGGFDWHINGQRMVSVGKTVYEDFSEYGDGDDHCVQADWTGCAATGANLVTFPSGNKIAAFGIVGQTIPGGVDMDAGSLDIAGDATENDGNELAWGTHGASGGAYTVGDDPAFFSCVQLAIADCSAFSDDFHFGFRVADDGDGDAGGFNATFDNYHDLAAWSILDTSCNVSTSTIAADAATSETDTTIDLTDADRIDLCIFVSAAGVTTFYYDGAAVAASSFSDLKPAPAAGAYTFTDAESVIPFMHQIRAASPAGEVDLYEWVVGYGTFPLTAAN